MHEHGVIRRQKSTIATRTSGMYIADQAVMVTKTASYLSAR